MKNQLLASTLLILTAMDVSAGWWREEHNKNLYADFGTYTFTDPANNATGMTFDSVLTVSVNGDPWTTHCDNGTTLTGASIPIYMTAYYTGPRVIIGGKSYMQVNDYLQASVRYTYNGTNINVPAQNSRFGFPSERCGTATHTGNTQFTVTMRISKPFVGFTDIDIPLADFYVGDNAAPYGSALINGAKQTLHLRGRVIVPQNCIINDDVESIVDFGNIPTYSFKNAGIGNKINGIPKANMPLSVKCNNFISDNAPLTVRVQTDRVGGPANDIIVSNNPDIGFKMSDQNDNVLIPNNINSKIHFNNTNPANIVVKAWPVSVTGNQPTPGPFQARGYFRIDFD